MANKLTFMEMISPPEDISQNGHLIDYLFNYTTTLNIFFFVLVCIGLFGFSFLYAKKRHPKPYYTYGNKKVHILVATIIGIAVFIGIDLNITRMSNNDYIGIFINWPDETKEDVVKVQVLGQQWAWNFRQAGADGVFNTEDDIVTLNDLRVPAGKKVVFQILSKDVIHSLYFPNARRKTDAIPGRITRMWIQFNKPGNYDIACAEMCGTYHYRMKAGLTVYEEDDYQHWLSEAQQIHDAVNDPEDAAIYWGWKWTPNAKTKKVGMTK
jgi:cytochrome c oxidase subunit 2